jgi:hypothetical protein
VANPFAALKMCNHLYHQGFLGMDACVPVTFEY